LKRDLKKAVSREIQCLPAAPWLPLARAETSAHLPGSSWQHYTMCRPLRKGDVMGRIKIRGYFDGLRRTPDVAPGGGRVHTQVGKSIGKFQMRPIG